MKHKRVVEVSVVLVLAALLAVKPADGSDTPVEWTLSKGMNLRQIASDSYGHPAFSRMIALFNQVDPDQIRAGEIIRTPPLPTMFEELGLIPEYENAFFPIFDVVHGYQELLKTYEPLRRQARGNTRRGSLELPAELETRFLNLADSLKQAAQVLERQAGVKGNVPRQTLGQIRQSERILRTLASGQMDGYGYDIDEVFQRLAYALANAVAWSRE